MATAAQVTLISQTRMWNARGSDEHLDPREHLLPRKNSMLEPIGGFIQLDHITANHNDATESRYIQTTTK